jgi:hypothetical protein
MRFDARNFNDDELNSNRELPPGEYSCILSELNDKETRSGKMLALVFTIVSGPYANRKVFDNINYEHPNPEAVAIGRRRIAQLIVAIMLQKMEIDLNKLVGKRIIIRTKNEEYNGKVTAKCSYYVMPKMDHNDQIAPTTRQEEAPTRYEPAPSRPGYNASEPQKKSYEDTPF